MITKKQIKQKIHDHTKKLKVKMSLSVFDSDITDFFPRITWELRTDAKHSKRGQYLQS